MARPGLSHFAAILDEEIEANANRFVDMMMILRVATFTRNAQGVAEMQRGTEEPLAEVGGVWDRQKKRWCRDRDPQTYQVTYVPRGSDQEKPARWLARWLTLYAQGRRGPHWGNARRVFTSLLIGGRRGGKSHIAVVALVMFSLMIPRSLSWAISPTIDETAELIDTLKSLMPSRWYKIRQAAGLKADQFHFANLSKLLLLSGNKANSLKRGRVDMVLYNEGQKMRKKGWTQCRGAIADRAGLVIITANPPDEEIGRWIEDLNTDITSGKVAAVRFVITAHKNPFVDIEALEELRNELSATEAEREIDGVMTPIGDVVMHEFSSANVAWVPDRFVDITRDITRDKLGRRAEFIAGMDFQLDPHMACAVEKVFIDPDDPKREPHVWIVDECLVENANEEALVDALEAIPQWSRDRQAQLIANHSKGISLAKLAELDLDYDGPCYAGAIGEPDHCAVVADASGWWQDGAHHKGRKSNLVLASKGWNDLHRPQRDSRDNPRITERVKLTNRMLRNGEKKIHFYISPHCAQMIKAFREWSRKNGIPDRSAKQAHACDAATYPIYRLFGVPRSKNKASYKRINNFTRERIE